MKSIHILGCGGVGSWLAPSICLLCGDPDRVILHDGDKLEKKNLNRQLFSDSEIGKFKAECLASRYLCQFINKFYANQTIQLDQTDWILCCVDNNAGRNEALKSCDQYGCKAIFGANETHSAEAFFYMRGWKGKAGDPRVYYPEIESDKSNDPRALAIGCTGEAQASNRQLVSANFAAAALMQHLYEIWAMERPKLDSEAVPYLPHRIRKTLTKYETINMTNGN